MVDYEPFQRCAGCDCDIPERLLLDHFEACKIKTDGRPEFRAYGDRGFEVGDTRVFEYAPLKQANGETRLSPREIDPGEAGKAMASAVEGVQTHSLEVTMQERNARYGDFKIQARVGKAIRFAMRLAPNWHKLTPSQELALDWISDKIARILCGDTRYSDNWHDLAGYANLGERDCLPPGSFGDVTA